MVCRVKIIFLPALFLYSSNEYVSQMASEKTVRTRTADLLFLLLCHQLPTVQMHKIKVKNNKSRTARQPDQPVPLYHSCRDGSSQWISPTHSASFPVEKLISSLSQGVYVGIS